MARRRQFDPSFLGPLLLAWYTVAPAFVTASAGKVSAWAPALGGTGSLTQATGTAQPSYLTAGLAGSDCLSFDGAATYMEIATQPAAFPTGTAGVEIWVVVDAVQVAATGIIVAFGGTGGGSLRSIRRSSNGQPNASDGSLNTSIPPMLTGRHVAAARWRGNGDVMVLQDRAKGLLTQTVVAATSGRFRVGGSTAVTPASLYQGLLSDVVITQPLPPNLADELAAWGMRKAAARF